jgi:hypothetical protein
MQQHIGQLFSQARDDAAVEFQDSPEMQQLTAKTDKSKK